MIRRENIGDHILKPSFVSIFLSNTQIIYENNHHPRSARVGHQPAESICVVRNHASQRPEVLLSISLLRLTDLTLSSDSRRHLKAIMIPATAKAPPTREQILSSPAEHSPPGVTADLLHPWSIKSSAEGTTISLYITTIILVLIQVYT